MDKITIKPSRKFQFLNLKEIWQYRELLFTFVERDIKVRYRQTIIGGLWAIIQPFSTMVVFSFFFGHLAGISGDGVPYPIFSYSGLVLWTYFAGALSSASSSVVSNSGLITKVYFPRIIVPIAATMTGLLDYFIALLIVFGMMVYYKIPLTSNILLLPITVLLTWILAMGMGFWLSAINVKFRDVGYIVPFFISLLLFVTPVIYPLSVAPNFRNILILNPMAGIIEAHRAMILGNQPVNWWELGISTGLAFIIFITGSAFFHRAENFFADII